MWKIRGFDHLTTGYKNQNTCRSRGKQSQIPGKNACFSIWESPKKLPNKEHNFQPSLSFLFGHRNSSSSVCDCGLSYLWRAVICEPAEGSCVISGGCQELDGQSRETSCLCLPVSWLVKESTGACCRWGPSVTWGEGRKRVAAGTPKVSSPSAHDNMNS